MALSDYRTAVVTGASRGIGADTVRRLSARGIEVHAVSRQVEKLAGLAAETGCRIHGLDIADRAAVLAAFAGMEADILVNNAAAPGTTAPLHGTDEATIDALLGANLKAPLNLLAAVVPGMVTRGLDVSSIAAHRATTGMSAYAATKAGLSRLTRNLRMELHGTGVRVTEIVPGRVETGIHLDMMDDPEEARRRFYEGYASLQPDDIASAIFFALDAPHRMDVTFIEILPTDQVFGGSQFHKRT
jgi:NADP-dependent 3-hydroxy acid dehydrogenase YdfG